MLSRSSSSSSSTNVTALLRRVCGVHKGDAVGTEDDGDVTGTSNFSVEDGEADEEAGEEMDMVAAGVSVRASLFTITAGEDSVRFAVARVSGQKRCRSSLTCIRLR